jgi:hypothetical protein
MIKDLLENRNSIERANIKSEEISKLDLKGKFDKGGYEIEITSPIKKIDGGIEFYARAWKNGKPVGFGKDGTTETERFRIFNPVIEVPDGTKREIEATLPDGKKTKHLIDNFKEDLPNSLKRELAHIIKIAGREDTEIILGSIGHTTSTFYPDAGTGSTTVDGKVMQDGGANTWATIIAAAGNVAADTAATDYIPLIYPSATTDRWVDLSRGIFTFNTAVINTDEISSAIFSLYGADKTDAGSTGFSVNIYSAAPASNNVLVAGDYDSLGTTAYSDTNIAYADLSLAGYNDWAFNATGKSAINKTGITPIGVRNNFDVTATPPNWGGSDQYSAFIPYMADNGSNKPKLVVVHAPSTSIKKVAGVAYASIKKISGVAIASVKKVASVA